MKLNKIQRRLIRDLYNVVDSVVHKNTDLIYTVGQLSDDPSRDLGSNKSRAPFIKIKPEHIGAEPHGKHCVLEISNSADLYESHKTSARNVCNSESGRTVRIILA